MLVTNAMRTISDAHDLINESSEPSPWNPDESYNSPGINQLTLSTSIQVNASKIGLVLSPSTIGIGLFQTNLSSYPGQIWSPLWCRVRIGGSNQGLYRITYTGVSPGNIELIQNAIWNTRIVNQPVSNQEALESVHSVINLVTQQKKDNDSLDQGNLTTLTRILQSNQALFDLTPFTKSVPAQFLRKNSTRTFEYTSRNPSEIPNEDYSYSYRYLYQHLSTLTKSLDWKYQQDVMDTWSFGTLIVEALEGNPEEESSQKASSTKVRFPITLEFTFGIELLDFFPKISLNQTSTIQIQYNGTQEFLDQYFIYVPLDYTLTNTMQETFDKIKNWVIPITNRINSSPYTGFFSITGTINAFQIDSVTNQETKLDATLMVNTEFRRTRDYFFNTHKTNGIQIPFGSFDPKNTYTNQKFYNAGYFVIGVPNTVNEYETLMNLETIQSHVQGEFIVKNNGTSSNPNPSRHPGIALEDFDFDVRSVSKQDLNAWGILYLNRPSPNNYFYGFMSCLRFGFDVPSTPQSLLFRFDTNVDLSFFIPNYYYTDQFLS